MVWGANFSMWFVLLFEGGFQTGLADGRGGVPGPSGVLPVILAACSCSGGRSREEEASGMFIYVLTFSAPRSLSWLLSTVCVLWQHNLVNNQISATLSGVTQIQDEWKWLFVHYRLHRNRVDLCWGVMPLSASAALQYFWNHFLFIFHLLM